MKKIACTILFISFLVAACSSPSAQQVGTKKIEKIIKTQPPGTTIAADSMLYNKLNNFYFTVAVKTTAASGKGTYEVETSIGPSTASSKFTMPRGAEEVVPVLHRIKDSTAFIIGFYYNDETTFYDYYKVKAAMGNIEMKYTTAYRFD